MTSAKNRVAIVTGASSGIGAAIAQRLAENNISVLMTSRHAEKLQPMVETINKNGGIACSFAQDLSDPQCGEQITRATLKIYGRIDIIVTCASTTQNMPFLEVSDAAWISGFDTKVFGAIRLCRAAWQELVKTRGNVVMICGIGPHTPRNTTAMSSLLSAPLYALTKVLADLGLDDGVRVNAINPGPVHTPRLEAQIEHQAGLLGITPEAMREKIRTEVGFTRWGKPDDIASLVHYILSKEGELFNGALLDIDGGATKGI